jgi:hypothetical protein
MSLDYITATYHVPASKGTRIRYTGGHSPKLGTITGASGGHILVKFDGHKDSLPCHPTWKIEYLADAATATEAKP